MEVNDEQSKSEMLEQRKQDYEARVLDLQYKRGWSPRQAKRHLINISRRTLKHFNKARIKYEKQSTPKYNPITI